MVDLYLPRKCSATNRLIPAKEHTHTPLLTMKNDEGRMVDLYLPRKCSATNRLIPAKEHNSVQLNIAKVDEEGQYKGEFHAFSLAGFIRNKGEADACLNRLLHEKDLLTFSH